MSPEQYRETRKTIGTQAQAAALLGIKRETISRREKGSAPISREASLALKSLAGTRWVRHWQWVNKDSEWSPYSEEKPSGHWKNLQDSDQ